MNELQIFSNSQFGEIRTTEINNKPYFCGSDVAKSLGYNEPHKAISRHCKGGIKRPVLTNGGSIFAESTISHWIPLPEIPSK